MNFMVQLGITQKQTDLALRAAIQYMKTEDKRLEEAMSYSLFNGGKRMRPLLVQGAALASGDHSDVSVAMAAVEMVHCYSLVHDDLPAMDDDDLRRGKPTCHIAYGEAMAILVGDALLTGSIDVVAGMKTEQHELSCNQRLSMIKILTQGAGSQGMVSGQSIDLSSIGKDVSLNFLENMHWHKTGALIRASVLLGEQYQTHSSSQNTQALIRYADAIGLAFQIQDDILDVESDAQTLGKRVGVDAQYNKPTYPSLLGMAGAKQKMADLHEHALQQLTHFSGDVRLLKGIADYVVAREY
jgi:geranylgeranyl pyrophosphate synthase